MEKALLVCSRADRAHTKYRENLLRQGYEVLHAEDASEAKELFTEEIKRVSFGGNECTWEEAEHILRNWEPRVREILKKFVRIREQRRERRQTRIAAE